MTHFSRQLHRFVLPLVIASCSRGEVDLGQGNPVVVVPRGARCVDSTVIDGAVNVHNQDEIAALAGCEEIHGDLVIQHFQGADLSPLGSLRSVEGALFLGAGAGATPTASLGASPPGPEDLPPDDPTLTPDTDPDGWLTSLTGLDALESIGSLTLSRTAVPDLLPLAHLRSLGSDYRAIGSPGEVDLLGTRALRDLSGLEHAAGLRSINFQGNMDLESLNGLNVPEELSDVFLFGNPALAEIDALATLTRSDQGFMLEGSGVTDLDALSGFVWSPTVDIWDNSQLVDATGLNPLNVTKLSITSNPLLEQVSSFSRGSYAGSKLDLEIAANDALESVTLDFSRANEIAQQGFPGASFGTIDISGNKALASIRSTGGFATATSFSALGNDSLGEVDLSSFQSFTSLTIDENSALTEVDVPALQTVDTLVVTNNPQLSTANFAPVRSFSSTMNGNADDTPAHESAPSGH